MAEYTDREHYIPLRKSDLVNLLCRDLAQDRAAVQQFRQLGELISATFHYEYYKLLDELKDEYAPFDPDSATVQVALLERGGEGEKAQPAVRSAAAPHGTAPTSSTLPRKTLRRR